MKLSFHFHFNLVIETLAIQAEVRLPNVEHVNEEGRRKKRQTQNQRDIIERVLNDEFCGKIQTFLVGNKCSIQNIQYKHDGSTGVFVNFLIVTTSVAASVSEIVTELKNINDALQSSEGLEFLPGVISGK